MNTSSIFCALDDHENSWVFIVVVGKRYSYEDISSRKARNKTIGLAMR